MKKLGQTFVDVELLIRASQMGAVFTFLFGASALAGWTLDLLWLKALPFGAFRAVTIKPNSAICLCLLGISLGLAHRRTWGKFLAKTLGLLVAAVGAATLAEVGGGDPPAPAGRDGTILRNARQSLGRA